MEIPPTEGMLDLPADAEGPTFREPWEAQAFAIVLRLYQSGAFTWAEWVGALSAEIARAKQMGDPDLGDTYYRHWLTALETLVIAKGLVRTPDLAARKAYIAAHPPDRHHVAQRKPVKIA